MTYLFNKSKRTRWTLATLLAFTLLVGFGHMYMFKNRVQYDEAYQAVHDVDAPTVRSCKEKPAELNTTVTVRDYDAYLDALAWVESRNRPLEGRCGELGPWQITRDYWEEGLLYWCIPPNTPGYEFTLENCSSRDKAWAAISGYAMQYDQKAIMTCDYRRMAQLHHGMNRPKKQLDAYTNKVISRMNRR